MYRILPNVSIRYCKESKWHEKRQEGEVVIPMIDFIEGRIRVPMGTVTKDYLRAHRLAPTQCAPNMLTILGSVDALNERMGLRLTHHNVNWVYNLHHLMGRGEWNDGLPYLSRKGKPDKNAAIPKFSFVNQESLDKIVKAEVFVHTDSQLRAAHIILDYVPISKAFQAPKYVIKAKDPRLHQISVAAPGFLIISPIPEGVLSTNPIPEGVPMVEASSSYPAIEEKEEEKEEETGEIVEVSDSEDDFGVFNQLLSSDASLGRDAPGKTTQKKPPNPSPALPLQNEPTDLKRKRGPKGKEVVEVEKTHPSPEDEAQSVTKQAKVGQKEAERRIDPQVTPLAWLLTPMLNGDPLPSNASIRDFQGGKASYVADVVEQALLLPEDMAKLWSIKKHEVFLSLKRYLAMAVQASFWVKEITNYCHRQMKEEEGRRNAAVEAFKITALKKKLEEAKKARERAEKARDQAEQDGYDLGVAETEEALRVEVSRSAPSSSRTDSAPEVVEVGKDGTNNVPTSSGIPSEEAEQPRVREKEKNANWGVAPDVIKPSTVTQDPPSEKENPKKMEIVLATLPLPAKADLASESPKAL
ncbi:hypothetical protein SO802_015133 [Lithocarpus litseifolius]|uniref:Uncharacterized protein n=1 Tax=Lithocarpus litseifolius TaxID=425828 RepID=A0AAW2CV51_9ROSI